MNSLKRARFFNILLAVMVLFSVAWMFSGIKIIELEEPFAVSRWEMLRFYTVDSNILMGIISLVTAYQQHLVITGKKETLGTFYRVLKLVGLVGVTLTMLVAMFFLAPTTENGWVTCYSNSNLFLHLLNPCVGIYTFIRHERSLEIKKIHTLTGISSMAVYATLYVINCLMHRNGNLVDKKYDWYGFFGLGVKSIYFILPLIIGVTYLISLGLWFCNRGASRLQHRSQLPPEIET